MNAAPNPKDTQDFQFKHACTQHVCDNLQHIPVACNLIVADNKRGLLYIAYNNKLTVLKNDGDPKNRCAIDYDVSYPISKLSLSCDYSYLGVISNKSTAYIYNASSLSKNSLELLHEVQLSSSSPHVYGYDLRWNPAVPGMFCTVASDHSIGCFQIKVEQKTTVKLVAWEKIVGLEAMCVAWSPKGKQLVVGCKNGNIVQLKPELKVARTIPGPSPAIGEVIAILWISNYQFCAAYSNINDRRINVLIVNAPKGETLANFMCYEDITYGMPDMESEYLPRYYFDHIPEWNLIIAASSSSSEVAILGSLDNGANWEQWQLIDSARAQLPLIRTTETYPIGMTIDKSSTIKLPWGPENTLPNPVPILYIFGTSGQVISFHMVNLLPNSPSICSPPTEQITLISPPRASILPSEISFNNHPGITSTPRPKQAEVIMEKPKTLPNANLFNNSVSAGSMVLPTSIIPPPPPPSVAAPASAVAAIVAVPTATQVMAPAFPTQVDLKISKPRPEKVEVPAVQKTEPTRLSPVKEVSTAAPASDNVIIDDSICWRAYQEEFTHFEKELKAKLEPQVWQVGTEEERQKLITQCAEIDEFWRELRETTNSLTSEIAYLKALLLQSFAWVEETKSRNLANESDTPRDRHDRSKIEELQRLATYTQSQLIQAMKALDMQWIEYQSQERSKMRTPKLEFIYQGLKKQSEIIASHKKIIEQQIMKLKTLSKVNKISDLNRSIAKLNLNTNTSGTSSRLNVNSGIIEMRCRTIANNMKNFTREKQLILRDILLQNTPKVIKPIVPTPVQDRLEATLSSLASLSPVTAPSTQKIGKLVPERSPVIKTIQTTVTTATIITPIANPVTTTAKSPLASLTSIVSNIGTPALEAATPPQPPSLSKTQPTNFSIGAFPSFFTNTSTLEKINTPTSTQFTSKPNITNQSPLASSSSTSITQPSTIATAFPKMMSISFGTPSQKIPEAAAPVNISTKETPQKNIIPTNPKEIGNATQSTQPLFDTNLFATSVNTAPPTSKIDQFATQQTQPSTGLESNLTMSFNNSLLQPTTNPQSVFSFASPTSTAVAPKTAVTTTNNVQTESIKNFSFASKPLNPPAFSSANPENLSSTKPAVRSNLDLSKMTVGLSSPNAAEKPPISTVTNSSAVGATFGESPTSIASTINFGKASLSTPAPAQPQQENKSPIALPAGTTIEKVGGFSGMLNPTTSGSSIFGGNSALTTNMFKSSLFGGTSISSALPQVPPLSATNETPTATSTPSIFGTTSNNVFAQNPVTSTNTPPPPPPTYSNSHFNNMLGDPTKNVNFGNPPQAPEVSSIFGKNSAPTVSSSVAAPSSPFAQTPSSPVSATNLTKSPSTTTASTNFFANTNSANNSIFGEMAGGATAPSKLFSGSSTISTAPSSIFDGATAAPATAAAPSPFGGSIFGGSSTFGASTAMPAATPAFGATPAFPAKPIFGGQPSMFGATKPEFTSPFGFGGPSGFGTAPNMTASPPALGNTQMGKVFGSPTGDSTFESLAGQNNQLTFDSLAQKSPSPEKPPSFSGGSSFSSWR